jgi:hypothetical protein
LISGHSPESIGTAPLGLSLPSIDNEVCTFAR